MRGLEPERHSCRTPAVKIPNSGFSNAPMSRPSGGLDGECSCGAKIAVRSKPDTKRTVQHAIGARREALDGCVFSANPILCNHGGREIGIAFEAQVLYPLRRVSFSPE